MIQWIILQSWRKDSTTKKKIVKQNLDVLKTKTPNILGQQQQKRTNLFIIHHSMRSIAKQIPWLF